MATLAQIEANRANAQKSTGPRSVEGKAASSRNALKHGIDADSTVIPGEDAGQYEQLAAGYLDQFNPANPPERFQVDTLIDADWQRRRLKRVRDNLYRALLAEGVDPEGVDPTSLRDSPTGKLLLRVLSRISSLECAYARALAELRRIRRESAQAGETVHRALSPMNELEAPGSRNRDSLRQRIEPNSPPTPKCGNAPEVPFDNPALRL